NYIGVDVTGNTALPNGGGILLQAPGDTVGGTAAGNVISGNSGDGILLYNATSGIAAPAETLIQGNTIGLGADGTTPVGNKGYGIYLALDARNVSIGGTTPAARNVIPENNNYG